MTSVASRTQVRADGEQERLSARCLDCDDDLLLAHGADVGAALAALDAAHPPRPHRRRPGSTPTGWVRQQVLPR